MASGPITSWKIDRETMETVRDFIYLFFLGGGVSKITVDCDFSHEIKRHLLLHCWWECKLVQPLWRTVWRFLKKLEIELPYNPAIPLLGIHSKETRIERDTCTPMFRAALFTIARTWKQPRCPLADEWTGILWYIYTMECYSAIKKNAFESVLMRWRKLEPIIQSKVSQKEKQSSYTNACMWNLERRY